MSSGTSIQTTNGSPTAIGVTVNTASGTGNAALALLQSGATGVVTVNANGGAVTDNNAAANNIEAAAAALSGGLGVGSAGNSIETTVNNLLGSRQTFGEFKGVTTAMTSGNIMSGTSRGIPAASAICAAQFGTGAYMCSVYDIYMNVARDKIKSSDTVAKSWVYMQSWKDPAGSAVTRTGLNDNCGSYMSNASTGIYGTAFEWTALTNGAKAMKFSSGGTAPNAALCNANLPIACCL